MSHNDPEVRALMRAAKTLKASIKHLHQADMRGFAHKCDDMHAGVQAELRRRLTR